MSDGSPALPKTQHRAAPEIGTARLRLRAHLGSDLEASRTMWADPEVIRFIAPVLDADGVAARNAGHAAMWARHGFGFWAIEDRADGRFLGEMGLARFERALEPPLASDAEFGWVLTRGARGRGVATEAGEAVLGWADGQGAFPLLQSLVDFENAVGLRLAAKLGFEETGQAWLAAGADAGSGAKSASGSGAARELCVLTRGRAGPPPASRGPGASR